MSIRSRQARGEKPPESVCVRVYSGGHADDVCCGYAEGWRIESTDLKDLDKQERDACFEAFGHNGQGPGGAAELNRNAREQARAIVLPTESDQFGRMRLRPWRGRLISRSARRCGGMACRLRATESLPLMASFVPAPSIEGKLLLTRWAEIREIIQSETTEVPGKLNRHAFNRRTAVRKVSTQEVGVVSSC